MGRTTSSWGEDPLDERRRHNLIRYGNGDAGVALALTARPYFVLQEHANLGGVSAPSLEALLDTTEKLTKIDELPRSQLKEMVRNLEGGREWAALAYRELLSKLPEEAAESIRELIGKDSPWISMDRGGQGLRLTQLKDLIECLELRYLGRRKQEQDS